MVECAKHGMILEIDRRYIMRIIKLVLEFWVCVVEVIAIATGAIAALRCVDSILLCKVVLWHIFMLINHCRVLIMLSVVSVRLLLRLVVFLWDFLRVMCGLVDRFLMLSWLLFILYGEVCSNSRSKFWLFVDRLFTAHFRFLLMSRFAANWLSLSLLTSQVKLGLTHRHFFILRLLLFKFEVAVTSNFVMDWHSGDFLNVFVSGIVMDGGGLDVSNSLMDNWGCDYRLRMVISYRAIVAFIVTRVEMLINRRINPAIALTIFINCVIQISITLEVASCNFLVGLLDFTGLSLVSQNTSTLHTKHFLFLLVELPSILLVMRVEEWLDFVVLMVK